MNEIKLYDKKFVPYITNEEIQQAVKKLSTSVFNIHENETPIFIGVLSGVIMFMSDFLKYYPGTCEVAFVKLISYQGTKSSEKIIEQVGITTDITNRHIVILEDIIDTGKTLLTLHKLIKNKFPKSIISISLFLKSNISKKDLFIDLIGIYLLSNKFVVGYGLDYNGLGRNYTDLYQLK